MGIFLFSQQEEGLRLRSLVCALTTVACVCILGRGWRLLDFILARSWLSRLDWVGWGSRTLLRFLNFCFAFSAAIFISPRRTHVSSSKTMLLSVRRRVVGMRGAVSRGSAFPFRSGSGWSKTFTSGRVWVRDIGVL